MEGVSECDVQNTVKLVSTQCLKKIVVYVKATGPSHDIELVVEVKAPGPSHDLVLK